MEQFVKELVKLRGENSKTFELGGRKRRFISGGGVQHWKEDYSNKSEEWKECDLRWDGNRIDKAPYILVREGNKLTFTDRKTWETSTIERVSVKPSGLKIEIIPFESGVKFQHILPTDKVPFEAQFKVTGKVPVSRAYDDAGELELEVSYDEKTGVLTERLTEIRSADSKELRQASGEIRIDPTLTVQPTAKDNWIYGRSSFQLRNYGNLVTLRLFDRTDYTHRTILEFDISELPAGANVTSASLQLYYSAHGTDNPDGLTVWAYKLTRTDWIEGTGATDGSESCWTNYKDATAWTTAGGDYVTSNPSGGSTVFPASSGAWMSWDVKAIVEDAVDNEGWSVAEFLARFDDEDVSSGYALAYFHSKEYTTDTTLHPKLVIEYTEPDHRRSAFFPFM